MTNSICAANVSSIVPSKTHGLLIGGVVSGRNVLRVNLTNPGSEFQRFPSLDVKATPDSGGKTVKPRSIVCSSCEGNGAVACSQCKGNGVNSVDHFNGQFKAGGLCWLCRGKRDILCGDCNGAGFIGGFMSTHDD